MGEMTSSIIETCIQYGVLGVLGWAAIKQYMIQSKNTNDYMKKILEYITDDRKNSNTEVVQSLSLIIQTINKNHENTIKFKYELMSELQFLESSMKEVCSSNDQKEQMEKILDSVQELESSLKSFEDDFK